MILRNRFGSLELVGVGDLLAIDPGKTLGWANFLEEKLNEAGYGRELPFDTFYGGVVIECPRYYPGNNKGDANDLIDLAVLVGELRHTFQSPTTDVQLVFPRTWKGSVPKQIHNKRILSKLTPEELKLLPKRPRAKDYDHNMVDAIGLGLWKLGRL